ncbi:hypothetical protein AB4Y45_28030 [Paraburkholderia sp. EG287A]|uniref:hypothetical protein n=1 Tax=Paraburkholderia sp. EG287A TaxID=3237012 RepID=UPI0034D2C510
MSDEPLSKRWYKELFGVRRSIRYNARRRAFFDRLDQTTNMLAVIFGSTAVYGVLDADQHAVALVASGAVTIISAVNLVVGSSQRARKHDDFARQFSALERDMVGDESEEKLAQMKRRRLEIEAEEPPVMHVLNCICHNEQMRSEGYDREDLAKIRWWQRLFSQIIDLREDLIHSGA